MTDQVAAPAAEQENFAIAMLAAIAVAIAGVAAWAVLAETVQARVAIVAFGVAVGAAAAFRKYAPSNPRAPFAVVGITLVSAVIGLLASQYGLVAHYSHVSFLTVVDRIPLSDIPDLMTAGTSPMTWVIMALSGYFGYSASMRLRAQQRGIVPAPPYGAPTPQIPGAQQAVFDNLRAANAAADAAKSPEDPPQS